MRPDTERLTRRRYLLGVGTAATLSGCGESETAETDSGGTPTPDNPLAETDAGYREAVYRETPEGPLSIEAAIPDGEGPFPAVVHVHGGAWRYGEPRLRGLKRLVEAGIATASVEYRLSGTATYPAPVRDVVAAVRWVRANEPGWNIDTERVALLGGSAGAHLAALVAGAPEHPNFQPDGFDVDASAAVEAAVLHYGIYDLTGRDACADQNTRQFFGDACGSESVVAEASPITHVDGEHPPVWLFHGTADELVPPEQSQRYRDALDSAGVSVEYTEIEGANHGYIDPNNEGMADTRRKVHGQTADALLDGVLAE